MQYNPNIRCDVPMVQPMAFNQGQPPVTPQIPNVSQQVQQLIPYVAAELATQCSQNVSTNPHAGRIYLFNQLSMNGYSNTDYVAAVQLALDIFQLNTAKRVYTDTANGIRDAVAKSLGILGSMNIASFQILQSRLDQAIVNEAMMTVQLLPNLNQEIQQMKYQAAQRPEQMLQSANGFGATPMQVGTPLGNQLGGNNIGLGASINNAFSSNQNNNQPLNNNQLGTPLNSNQGDRNAYLRNNQQAQQNNNNVQQTQQSVYQAPPPPPTPKVWLPSNRQAYPPAYVVGKQVATLVASMDPITSQPCAVFEITEETDMDRTKHQIVSSAQAFISSPVEQGISREQSVQNTIEKATKKMAEMINDVSKEPIAKIVQQISDTVIHATSLSGAIFDARYRMAHSNDGVTVCKSLISPVLLTTPYVTRGDQRELVNGMRACSSFKDVATYLSTYIRTNSFTDAGVREFVMNIDMWLTAEFNNVISRRLCLDAYSIDSFIDDADAFFGYIRTKRGDIYADALVRTEKQLIDSWIAHIDEEDIGVLNRAVMPVITLEEAENEPVYLTLIPNYITVTIVGVHSSEIKVGIPTKGSATIDSTNFPFLHKFVAALYSKTRSVDVQFNHHYIVTSDNVCYEVSEGLVGYGAYLISVL